MPKNTKSKPKTSGGKSKTSSAPSLSKKTTKTRTFELLKKDHRKVEAIFKELSKTPEKSLEKRQDLFGQLEAMLIAHTGLEEALVYPKLEDAEKTHTLSLEAQAEHNLAKLLLEQLGLEDKTTEQWSAKLTVLEENIKHHVKDEETKLFPKAERALPKEELELLQYQIKEQKERQQEQEEKEQEPEEKEEEQN